MKITILKVLKYIFYIIILNIVIIVSINNFLLKYLSPDGNYAFYTLLKYLFPFNILLILILWGVVSKFSIQYYINKVNNLILFFKKYNNTLKLYLIFLLFGIYIFNSLYPLLNLDISTDESTYMSTYKNYYEYNNLMFSIEGNTKIIPKDLLGQHIILFLIKPFTEFSIYTPRIITFLYSLCFVLFLFLYIKINYNLDMAIMAIFIITASPMFIFLSGSSFGENITIFYFFIGFLFYEKFKKFRKKYILIFSYLFITISLLTKLQFAIVFISAYSLYILFAFINKKNYKEDFLNLVMIIILSIFIFTIKLSFYGFDDVSKILISLAKTAQSAGVNISPGLIDGYLQGLIRVIKNQNLFFIAIAIFLPIYCFNRLSKYDKILLLMVFTNFLWYLHKSYGFRFGYFAFFSLLILSIKSIYLLHDKNIKKLILIFILIFYILGVSENIYLSYIGVSNKYQLYLNGDASIKVSERIVTDRSQNLFYSKVGKILKNDDIVLFVGAESEMAAFLPNTFYDFRWENRELLLKKCDYILVSAVTNQLRDFDKNIYNFINDNSDLIINNRDYYLYKIKSKNKSSGMSMLY